MKHLFLLFFFALPLTATDDIITRTKITPESAWVGQRMTLKIDVLGKDGWAQITDLENLEIPNCYRLPAGNSRVRLQEKIEGADYWPKLRTLTLPTTRWRHSNPRNSFIHQSQQLGCELRHQGAGRPHHSQLDRSDTARRSTACAELCRLSEIHSHADLELRS